ncbi:Pept-C1 domain-containing protein [Aphelenchoides besseyi]|nr:Pept-C1 domain-containing protein [Aphelenchoides besseyi]
MNDPKLWVFFVIVVITNIVYPQNEEPLSLPEYFNAAEHWPHCRQSILSIDNQLDYGICLLTALTHSLADRFCVATNSSIHVSLSIWEAYNCCYKAHTHTLLPALLCLLLNGTTTGGNVLHADPGCIPFVPESCFDRRVYTIPEDLSVSLALSCLSNYKLPQSCPRCQETSPKRFYPRHIKDVANPSRMITSKNTTEIMTEIMRSGPVVAIMKPCGSVPINGWIVKDYEYTPKGHVIRIIGWGRDPNGTDYWLLANSYGIYYGDGGLVKIERGSNVCDIENFIIALQPDVDRFFETFNTTSYRMNLTYIPDKPVFDSATLAEYENYISNASKNST